MKTATRALLLLCLAALAALPAHARRTLEVKAVEPATTVLRNGAAHVTLTVQARPGDDTCVAIVSIEGERPRSLHFGPGKPETQQLRLTFTRADRYIINIGPREGKADCTRAQAVVSVHDAAKAAAAACPDGWSMAASEGARYTCRLIPPRPLACADGTRYFSQGTQIGCR